MCSAHGVEASRHTRDQFGNQRIRYGRPGLSQPIFKLIPLPFCVAHVVKLGVQLMEFLFECPPEVFDGVEIRRKGGPVNSLNVVIPEPSFGDTSSMDRCIIPHKYLPASPVRY